MAAAPTPARARTQVRDINGNVSYAHDGRGNQTVKDTTSDTYDRTISYTVDDKAREAATKAAARVRFWYGPDGARYKREDDGGARTTLYLGNVEVVTVNGVTTFRPSPA